MTVAIFKLMSGEEVICRVTTENDGEGCMIVNSPFQVHTQFDPAQGFRFGFSPFMVYAHGGTIKVPLSSLVAIGFPEQSMESEYLNRVDPNRIVVPEKPSIIVP